MSVAGGEASGLTAEASADTSELIPVEPAPRSRRRIRLAALAAVILAALGVIVAVLLGSRSAGHPGAGTGVPPGETTTSVTRRTLTESSTLSGTLGYSGSLEVYDRLASAGTFTWLPSVGAVVGRGGILFRINNLPVVLMYGSVPAYRSLKAGVSDGPDVNELNQNLIDLGYDPYGAITELAHFGEATAAAVRRWQHAMGLSQTAEVELGRVAFAPAAQRITKVHVALGQDPPGEPAPNEPAAKAPAPNQPAAKEPAAKEPAAKQPTAKEPAAKRRSSKRRTPRKASGTHRPSHGRDSTPREPAAAKPPAKESPAKESPAKEPAGSGSGAGTVVLSTTSTKQIVQLKVKASQQQLAHVGESAPVTLPDGEIVQGHVTAVGTVATEASESEHGGGGGGGGGENATISVTLELDHRVARLDAAPVSVALAKSIRRNVLTVPATALVATAGGGYAIEALEGGRRVAITVTPGMFAGGYVEIEGAGVHEGLTVTQSQ
ncbi:MAG TPA: peptidoglycan-binding protein [Solirubrobacteraceae bacterium]|nr:peptidoglycan-binding protein [Solirubrobacteraceae bacterium]